MNYGNKFRLVLLLSLFLLLLLIILAKVNLVTADLGRHLKNGEVILQGETLQAVLKTNFYSYTHQDYPFVNHHWGSGIIFYLVKKFFGFGGCSLFFAAISALTAIIFFLAAEQNAGFLIAGFAQILVLPLILYRREIRPEVFSYLFCGIFYWLLNKYRNKKINFRHLLWLPLMMIFWVNLHLYFFLGFLLIGAFALERLWRLLRGDKSQLCQLRDLGLITGLCLAASLINPAGMKGVLYPWHIFDSYGYRLLENQTLFFLERVLGGYLVGIFFYLCLGIFIASLIYVIFKERKINLFNFILSIILVYLAVKAVRNFSLLGYFLVPLLATNLKGFPLVKESELGNRSAWLSLLSVMIPFLFLIKPQFWLGHRFGLGLEKGNAQAADFFLKNNFKGPIFNNYDIGGYLIYFLYPQEKVFVDNRPEAYPEEFFNEVYVPMQENEGKWKEIDGQYHFNVIFFYRHDLTPWAQTFLLSRVKDQNWAPVFVDDYSIIFLRRNKTNQELIKKFELPKGMFSVKK